MYLWWGLVEGSVCHKKNTEVCGSTDIIKVASFEICPHVCTSLGYTLSGVLVAWVVQTAMMLLLFSKKEKKS